MKLIAKKSRLEGTVLVPASKSHTIRAVAIASLADGASLIRNPLDSSDTLAAVSCYRALGAEIDISDPERWKVVGTAGHVAIPDETIDVHNSGTTLRIALGSAALAPPGRSITFTGDEQIRSRPVGPLLDSLNELGATCTSLSNNGKAPVQVTGKLTGGRTTIAASTSQYLSSLLLAAPLAPKDTEIAVTMLNEPGYVQMTLDWLDRQRIEYENREMRTFNVKGNQSYKAYEGTIGGDFSSATFFLCAAALVGDEVTLLGLDLTDSQPDKAVVEYLQAMGADIRIAADSIAVKASSLHGTEIDMNKTPDALPAMAVVGAFAAGTTKLLNVPQARSKETDRIKCMAEELKKMYVRVEELPDGLIVHGSKPKPAELHGWGDHRIVMALSLGALVLDEPSVIDTAEAMKVTFPQFAQLMRSLGADMELVS
ncbi:MAG: 3-phosphoshikimate 1-carboxyvinyltransferase [Phycisphaerales bacterium]|nr:MAG: 3-phosphoshikimate 1-carboxyvinyltransferase [Phycisphaerales bacterium]